MMTTWGEILTEGVKEEWKEADLQRGGNNRAW